MNKEEIEKLLKINETIITSEQCKEHRTLKNDERVLLMNNIKIKDYIQELEFQNTALKAEHNHNITRIKELEQKESILDKVTDKLKEIKGELEDDGYDYYVKEVIKILNIIEGEREYCCTCGVELNSKNKALNNMCNECKYGLDYQKEREEK